MSSLTPRHALLLGAVLVVGACSSGGAAKDSAKSASAAAHAAPAAAPGEFTTRDSAPVRASKEDDTWTVAVGADEHYRFADAVIVGG